MWSRNLLPFWRIWVHPRLFVRSVLLDILFSLYIMLVLFGAIVLFVLLRLMGSNYSFDIFKHFYIAFIIL